MPEFKEPWRDDLNKIMDEIFADFNLGKLKLDPGDYDVKETVRPNGKTVVFKRKIPQNIPDKKKPIDSNPQKTMSLDDVIGLDDVKGIVKNIVDHYRMMKEYKSHGIHLNDISKHMVFTGNPGTGKTTVARILAGMLADNGVIKENKFIEASRGDLIGSYVGQTAPKVTAAFNDASGGVLFIDEAYSLATDADAQNGFGAEAISTIVMEMENRRDDVIVIFAGYKDEMEKLIDSNPGMKSRIAFYVDFPDYTPDEMLDICKSLVKDNDLQLSPKAKELLRDRLEEICLFGDIGNGRFARNIIEKSILAHSTRLVKDIGNLKKTDLKTLTKSDISVGLDEATS